MSPQHRKLPHIDTPGLIQSITFRLNDSLPAHVWQTVSQERKSRDQDFHTAAFLESSLDRGHGSCILRNPAIAEITQTCLRHGHPESYSLIAWVIMPNHVHVLAHFSPSTDLGKTVQSWKSVTAHRINRQLGRSGALWQKDYFDRFMRDGRHVSRTIEYIHWNPVKAGLCECPEDWRFSSAHPTNGWNSWEVLVRAMD